MIQILNSVRGIWSLKNSRLNKVTSFVIILRCIILNIYMVQRGLRLELKWPFPSHSFVLCQYLRVISVVHNRESSCPSSHLQYIHLLYSSAAVSAVPGNEWSQDPCPLVLELSIVPFLSSLQQADLSVKLVCMAVGLLIIRGVSRVIRPRSFELELLGISPMF